MKSEFSKDPLNPLVRLDEAEPEYDQLTCPYCGEDYLHHGRVRTYARDEDAARGTEAAVYGHKIKVDSNSLLSGNPSDRRGGIAISFLCEHCGSEPELALAQHKGRTFVFWRERT